MAWRVKVERRLHKTVKLGLDDLKADTLEGCGYTSFRKYRQHFAGTGIQFQISNEQLLINMDNNR